MNNTAVLHCQMNQGQDCQSTAPGSSTRKKHQGKHKEPAQGTVKGTSTSDCTRNKHQGPSHNSVANLALVQT